MNTCLTVTVGVPAHNEELVIARFLNGVLTQRGNFMLERIIVACDGCTDETAAVARSIGDSRIEVLEDDKRLGKPGRMNQIFEGASSDVVIILDADLRFAHGEVVNELLEPMRQHASAAHTSGRAMPELPRTPIQRVASTGVYIWDDVRTAAHALIGQCEGSIRAFRKDLYSVMRFPAASADDAFSYMYCTANGFGFAVAPNAQVYYPLATDLKTYVAQTTRIMKAQMLQGRLFAAELVAREFSIPAWMKMRALWRQCVRDPLAAAGYVVLVAIAKVQAHRYRSVADATWDTKSTPLP